MKTNRFINPLLALAVILGLGLSACKESSDFDKISEEDAEIVAAVVAETLSDNGEGFMTDVYDVQRGLQFDTNNSGTPPGTRSRDSIGSREVDQREWRSGERNHSHGYDPETGIHSFSYEREFVRGDIYKYMSASIAYIFYDVDGGFIQFPARQEVETIRFTGTRQLIMNGPFRSSESQRASNWVLSGLASGNIHTLAGEQTASGNMTMEQPRRGTFSRSYDLKYTFTDVVIEKAVRGSETLEDKVTGTVSYEISLTKVVNGEESTRQVRGTVELEGNGSALLRLAGLNRFYTINLADGSVSERR